MGHEHTQTEIKPGQTVYYLPTWQLVQVFGRERETSDPESEILYYWVYDGLKRFRAYPNELIKLEA